jgi:hypothetical protein
MEIEGQPALVAGGASGPGAATARGLGGRPAQIFAIGTGARTPYLTFFDARCAPGRFEYAAVSPIVHLVSNNANKGVPWLRAGKAGRSAPAAWPA